MGCWEAGWIREKTRDDLNTAYVFLRSVEHRIQMLNDEQTQLLPRTMKGFCGFQHLWVLKRGKLSRNGCSSICAKCKSTMLVCSKTKQNLRTNSEIWCSPAMIMIRERLKPFRAWALKTLQTQQVLSKRGLRPLCLYALQDRAGATDRASPGSDSGACGNRQCRCRPVGLRQVSGEPPNRRSAFLALEVEPANASSAGNRHGRSATAWRDDFQARACSGCSA